MEFSDFVAWMRENGAFVDDRIKLSMVDSLRGIIAWHDIEKDAPLFHCPWQLVLGSSSDTDTDESCAIVKAIDRELRLGEASPWSTYLDFAGPVLTRLPTLWDEATLSELQGLPPCDATRHIDWYSTHCLREQPNARLDSIALQALMLYVTRSTDRGMIPLCDFLNHHNGELNTVIEITETGVKVQAAEAIPAGKQIYNTYGVVPVSNFFRDYGFIEDWPQIWSWSDSSEQTHTFIMFTDNDIAIEPSEEFTSALGRKYVPLEIYKRRAREQVHGLSIDTLRRFHVAGARLLREAPTSPEEDGRILASLRANAGFNEFHERESEFRIEDLIACIQYRQRFKKAVRAAVACAERAKRAR